VDAFVVEERLYLFGDSHIVVHVETSDVGRCNDSVARQLPDVKLVDSQHSLDLHSIELVSSQIVKVSK